MTTRALVVLGGVLLTVALLVGGLSTALGQTTGGAGWGPGSMMGGFGGTMGNAGGMMGNAGGMMGGSGGMMGNAGGMMGGSGGMMGGSGGMMGGWGAGGAVTPLRSLAEAEQAFQTYLTRLGKADLALGEVMEFERNYYAIVEEKSTGSGAIELLADKQTGAVFTEYGPAMMWNTTYGHMAGGGMMGGRGVAGAATVTAERARELAQQWLDTAQPGSTADAPDAFPGYYTLHTSRDGRITGMLSVQAATGQVWYHSWHGAFIAATAAGH